MIVARYLPAWASLPLHENPCLHKTVTENKFFVLVNVGYIQSPSMLVLAIKLSEWIGMSTAVIGTVVSIAALFLQQRQRAAEGRTDRARERIDEVDDWEAERLSRAGTAAETSDAQREASVLRADATRAYQQAKSEEPSRRRWSYKAIAAAVIGIFTFLGAAVLLATPEQTGEPVTREDSLGVVFYAVIAVLLGLSARRDIKSDRARRGSKLAWTGIITAALAGLAALGAPEQSTSGQNPNLTIALLDDCTGYRVTNAGSGQAGAFVVVGTNSGGSTPFNHPGLGAGQSADNRFFANGVPSVGPTSVRADSTGLVGETNESDNDAQRQC